MRHAAVVLVGVGGGAGVFGDDQLKAHLPGVARGGFHANVGGDAAQNNRRDAATT